MLRRLLSRGVVTGALGGFGELLGGTFNPAAGANRRDRTKRVRNRKRGRSYKPSIYADPTGATRDSAKKTQTYRSPRPREASTWRRIPGIASGGDIAAAAGEATGYWLADKWLKRALGRNYPSDPGPRGRPKRATSAGGARTGGGDRGVGTQTPRTRPVPKTVRRERPEAPDYGPGTDLSIPGISGLPVDLPATAPVARPSPTQSTRARGLLSFGTFNETSPRTSPRPLRASVRPRAQARAEALGQPLTALNALGVPSVPTNDQDKCRCPKPKRKKGCTNPLISKSISGNVLTIKRELKCPPSNLKAR